MSADTHPDFALLAPLSAWLEKSGDSAKALRIGGIVSTDTLDRQGEKVVQDGLDFSEFMSFGWFNDNHKSGVNDALGWPTNVARVKKGDKLPNGAISKHNGWWADGFLANTKKGREVHEMIGALDGTERQFGFSIEGTVGDRQGKTIKSAAVRHVAITHVPVNADTGAVALAKALTAGSSVAAPGTAQPGAGFALRQEDLDHTTLDDEMIMVHVGDKKKYVRKGDLRDAPEAVSKGDNRPSFPEMLESEHVEEWAAALAENAGIVARMELPTPGEAEVIAKAVRPHATAAQRAVFVAALLGA